MLFGRPGIRFYIRFMRGHTKRESLELLSPRKTAEGQNSVLPGFVFSQFAGAAFCQKFTLVLISQSASSGNFHISYCFCRYCCRPRHAVNPVLHNKNYSRVVVKFPLHISAKNIVLFKFLKVL